MSFFLALLPIAWLILALTKLRMPSHLACLAALAFTVALACLWWRMPVLHVATAVLEGVLNALWPICLVVLCPVRGVCGAYLHVWRHSGRLGASDAATGRFVRGGGAYVS